MSGRAFFVVTALVAGLFGVRAVARAEEGAKASPALKVVVSIPPLKGLVAPLLPEGSTVTALVGAGQSEHGFELTPSMVDALGRADLVVLVGLGMEPQVERALATAPASRAPARRVLRFAEAVGVRAEEKEHGDKSDEHGQGGVDLHLWLDPMLCGKFVAAVADEVFEMLRERGGLSAQQTIDLKAARTGAERMCLKIDAEYTAKLETFKGARIVTHHDAFGRLASRYGLEIAATIKTGEGAEPTPGTIAEVAKLVREKKVRAIFAEPQSDAGAVKRLAEATGVKVLVLDPLGDGDWVGMMRGNLGVLVEGLGGSQ